MTDRRQILERFLREAPLLELRDRDPVRLCHRYPDPADREVVALVASLLAFGRVQAFLPRVEAVLARMGTSPRRYIERFQPRKDREFFDAFRLRIWKGESLGYLFANLRRLYREFGSLEAAFLAGEEAPANGISRHRARLTHLAAMLRRVDPAPWTGTSRPPPSFRTLVVDPAGGSACKRWNLFLRWVVRPADGVDLGLWTRVSPGDLVIPLDVHVGRISRQIGLRRRRTLDWLAAEEVTRALALIDPHDPVRFDLPLSHLGISSGCRGRYLPRVCEPCGIRSLCRVYRRRRAGSQPGGGFGR
jgi:uncharacterized protein (TIGR02757 family)